MSSLSKRIWRDIKIFKESNLDQNGIYCNFDEEDVHNVKVLIVGPQDTPYAYGFYLFRLRFPQNYPLEPPKVKFMTQGEHIRFNPNLYTNGKVCLSILGTWEGPGWTASCTLSSVLLSIQSLLNANPIHNEPGWETVSPTDYRCTSYNKVLICANIKIAIIQNIKQCQEEFICFLPIMKTLLEKNKQKIIDIIPKNIGTNNLVYSKTFNLALKFDRNKYLEYFDSPEIKKKVVKRKAPNIKSKDQEVGFRTISENDEKEYEVYLTKTGKKRWRLFKN